MHDEYKLPEVLTGLVNAKKRNKRALAKRMNIGYRNIFEWMNGSKMPSLYSLMALSKEFNVTLDYLVYGKETEGKNGKK